MGMATLRIPREQQIGFKKLIVLDDESVRALTSALRDEFPGLNNPDAISEMAASATGISSTDADELMGTLGALYVLRTRHESTIPDFVDDVCRALEETDVKELELSGDARERFKDRLALLLSVESISIESKAADLQYDNEHTYSMTLADFVSMVQENEKPPSNQKSLTERFNEAYDDETEEEEKELMQHVKEYHRRQLSDG